MNNQWLTIEQIGEDVVLKKCSREAEGTVVIPAEITKLEENAFIRTNVELLTYKGVTFQSCKLTSAEASEVFAKKNSESNKVASKVEDPNEAFELLYRNFLLHKECLLNVLKGEYYKIQSENAYYYLEKFIYERYEDLSESNKKWALIFMEHFSRSSVAGPSYPFHIYAGNIERDMKEAEDRLAAAVYNLSTPWGNFAKYNCIYLAKIHMLRSWEPEEKLKAESAAILFRHKEYLHGYPAHTGVFKELDVNVEELIKNEFKAYYEDYFNPFVEEADVRLLNIDGREVKYYDDSADLMKKIASGRQEEGLTEGAIASILCAAAEDICKEIASAEELELTPFTISLLEYFSNPENYPSVEDVNIEVPEHEDTNNVDSDFEDTLKALEHAHATHLYRVHFKPNRKFQSTGSGVFYMGFSDGWHYTIRERMSETYDDSNDPIVVTYRSMREVLMDGWLPD